MLPCFAELLCDLLVAVLNYNDGVVRLWYIYVVRAAKAKQVGMLHVVYVHREGRSSVADALP